MKFSIANAYSFMSSLLNQEYDSQKCRNFLIQYEEKNWSASILSEFVKAIKDKAILCPLSKPCIDICGTGGSKKNRFNVSSSSAIFLASLGIPVAKHGNYGSAKPNGSFDFLESLGLKTLTEIKKIQDTFDKSKLVFLLARIFHPALGFLAPLRKEIANPTVFNLLGPLCNPALPKYQLIGTTSYEKAILIAETLQILNTTFAVIIVGADGRDELSPSGKNKWITVYPNKIKEEEKTFNLFPNNILWENKEYDAKDNANLFLSLIKHGNRDHPIMQYIALNTAASLYVYNQTDLSKGYEEVLNSIQEKKVYEYLMKYKEIL